MASSRVQPFKGPFVYNFQELEDVAVDIVPGGTRGLCREKPGIATVLSELAKGIPEHAITLGIDPQLHTRIAKKTEKLAQVRAARVLVKKLVEVLDETEIHLEDEREGEIGGVVDSARKVARRKDPAVIAAFEKTIRYHGQIAAAGQRTRRKNEEGAEAEEEDDEGEDGDEAEAPATATPASSPALAPASSPASAPAAATPTATKPSKVSPN